MAEATARRPPSTGVLRSLFDDPVHGPLPAVLLLLTVVTGLVDAVSILSLGRVFVANMTGNVVFVGFALGGFLVGAAAGGRLIGAYGEHRPVLMRIALLIEFVLVTAALVFAAVGGTPIGATTRDVIAAVLAIALGLQNAVVRQLKVADLTTTVLTMTLTGIAADVRTQPRGVVIRRVLAVVMMLTGATGGALLVLHVNPATALGAAVAFIVIAFAVLTSSRAPWR
jgi:uncharacterized membrane protein YoaK (UPF0700 family)